MRPGRISLSLLNLKGVVVTKIQEGKELGHMGTREDQFLIEGKVCFTSEELDPLRVGDVLVDPLPQGIGLCLAPRNEVEELYRELGNSDLYNNVRDGKVWRPSQRFLDFTAFLVKS